MKRYLVFVYPVYYPCGGFNDLSGSADDLDAAKASLWSELAAMLIEEPSGVRGHVVDHATGEIVFEVAE